MFYVYLIQSKRNDSFYIGQTDDVGARLVKHNAGQVASTKFRRPWKLVGFENYLTRREARWREYTLKHNLSEKRKFLKKFLPSSFNG
ncbi:excinuclease ABC subunit C [Candidatus Jorgensenbacteria bacterium CG10_big_fil_rev_8_21_14_0_10_54_38]|uniref:Excinuclease ABC subunit C n=2 Tax=Candidatus Joergenseniibacteriota TaxID=1752739 RepID=A0A2M6WFW0_9BACT|nr:MAG: excinuclease ABC subunit C [Candidatus Jorgensenbacteria bacterium CG23_combo_of_CG06-09_8_20_14_all_54_14]PIT91637.1 MAG: excinuclease ABC subunit C [Candidatus Jorgensenbacteria bacterium CG10_big_fil_rev_8_21_14_0_10_54_38]